MHRTHKIKLFCIETKYKTSAPRPQLQHCFQYDGQLYCNTHFNYLGNMPVCVTNDLHLRTESNNRFKDRHISHAGSFRKLRLVNFRNK